MPHPVPSHGSSFAATAGILPGHTIATITACPRCRHNPRADTFELCHRHATEISDAGIPVTWLH